MVRILLPPAGDIRYDPSIRLASSENHLRNSAA
jgi:hypothetical protein